VSAALVFAAAPIHPTPRLSALLATLEIATVIAADDGATTALAFGLIPHVVIGDLDSVEPDTFGELRRHAVPIETYPRDKNATDGQLAVERALQNQPRELYLVGFLGGPRLDQALANIMLLTRIDVPTVLLDEQNECRLLHPRAPLSWSPEANEVVSLLPVTPTVDGVRTTGLRWPLYREQLLLGDTRGISNEPVGEQPVTVEIDSGLLLVTRHFPL
jgi:thiamine pyrophosphokinase